MDNYCRLLNGSTQVNATEINAMYAPSRERIMEFGIMSHSYSVLDQSTCDTIINYSYHGKTPENKAEEVVWENQRNPRIC
jgi:adenine-specific DNA-methyltransferase